MNNDKRVLDELILTNPDLCVWYKSSTIEISKDKFKKINPSSCVYDCKGDKTYCEMYSSVRENYGCDTDEN